MPLELVFGGKSNERAYSLAGDDDTVHPSTVNNGQVDLLCGRDRVPHPLKRPHAASYLIPLTTCLPSLFLSLTSNPAQLCSLDLPVFGSLLNRARVGFQPVTDTEDTLHESARQKTALGGDTNTQHAPTSGF